jgi:hypothetical protein
MLYKVLGIYQDFIDLQLNQHKTSNGNYEPAVTSQGSLPVMFSGVTPETLVLESYALREVLDTNLGLFSDGEVNTLRGDLESNAWDSNINLPMAKETTVETVVQDEIIIPPGDVESLLRELQKDADLISKAKAYVMSYYASKYRNDQSIGLYFEHNWESPLTERIEYRTNIITARGGEEQRRPLRSRPRTTLEYSYLLTNNRLQYLKNFILRHQSHKLKIPMWHKTQAAYLGDSQIRLKFPLKPGESVLVGSSMELPDIREVISSTYDGEVYLTELVGETEDSHNHLTPVRTGRLRQSSQISYITPSVARARVTVELDDYVPDKVIPLKSISSPTNDTVVGNVFLIEPNYATNVTGTYDRRTADVDYGNAYRLYDLEATSEQKLQLNFMVNLQRTDVNVIDLFHFARGSANQFYFPTYLQDLAIHPSETVGAGEFKIRLKPSGYKFIDGIDIGFHVVIFFHSRPPLITHVNKVFNMGGFDQARFSVPFSSTFTAKDVKMISKLNLCRFSSDTLEVSWKTRELAEVTTQIEVLNAQ